MARKTLNTKSIKTIAQATEHFLLQSKPNLKESTFSRYSFICERHIVPYFEGLDITELNSEHISSFTQDKLSNGGLTGKPMSPKTINDMVCVLIQIAKISCELDVSTNRLIYKQNDINVFTETEYDRLKTYLAIGLDNKKLGIVVAMLTGIRIGELCALKWDNIDLNNGIITIDKTMQRIKVTADMGKAKTKIIIDSPKSIASMRAIPIPSTLHRKLEEFQASDSTYLLTNTTDYIEPRIYQRHFKNYLEACNIKDKNFHALRHTFATRAISKEMDIKTLSILLGHTDVGFTMKRYVHPNMEHKRAQIEKFAVDFNN